MNQNEANLYLWAYQFDAASKTGLRPSITLEEIERSFNDSHGHDSSLTPEELEQFRQMRATIGKETDIIRYHADILIKMVPPAWRAKIETIPVGTLPHIEVNAATIRTPSGDPIIVVATGLSVMLFEVAAWCAAATPLAGSPPEAELGDATRNIFQWTVFYVTRSPEWLPKEIFRSQSPIRRNLIGALYANAIFFVLGHEYGHAILGHLEQPECKVRNIAKRDARPLTAFDFSYQMEFDADAKGLELALEFSKANHGGWIGAALSGTEVALQVLRLLEELFPSRTELSTHPPAAERLERVHAAVRGEYGDKIVDSLRDLTAYFDITAAVGRQILARI